MPSPFEILGVDLEASDAEIRQQYLKLIREFPPERAPDQFAKIRQAYEQISELEKRASYFLYKQGTEETLETIIEEAECLMPRPRPSLDQFLTLLPKKNPQQ